MPRLTNQQLNDFLTSGAHLMKLATLTPEGWPYVAPVWYDYDGEAFYVAGRRTANWVAHIRDDERVSACIDTCDAPYTRVIVEGTAEIVDGAWMGDWKHWAVRYRGEEEGTAYYEETKHMPRAYIRIMPRKITTWAGPGWHPRYQE